MTQRPGWSCLAISVNTLTTGSQATVNFRSPDFINNGAEGPLRASRATGMRTRTDVSESPYNRSEIVRVGTAAAPAPRAARSALAARLMEASDVLGEFCVAPERSRPDANWTAPPTPHISETASAANNPLDSCDMMRSSLAPWRSGTQRERDGPVLKAGYHLTVCKKNSRGWGTTLGVLRHPDSRLSPLPH